MKNDNKKKIQTSCDICANYCFDEDTESYVCLIDLDEDEFAQFLSCSNYNCPYFRLDDEYGVVRHQN